MSTLKVNTVQHNTSGFNNVVQFTDGAGTQNGTLCRAWVNFNGTGTVAIRAQFNVSSITDNSTGNYTVNFTNAMTDANYSVAATNSTSGTATNVLVPLTTGYATGSIRLSSNGSFTPFDSSFLNVAIFR